MNKFNLKDRVALRQGGFGTIYAMTLGMYDSILYTVQLRNPTRPDRDVVVVNEEDLSKLEAVPGVL